MSIAIREEWVSDLTKVARVPLEALAAGRLRSSMPLGNRNIAESRIEHHRSVYVLEALGRTLAGIAPWLELHTKEKFTDTGEATLAGGLTELAHAALTEGLTPGSPDELNFSQRQQPLVDAAFLAHALLRAPTALCDALSEENRTRLIDAFYSTRVHPLSEQLAIVFCHGGNGIASPDGQV
jgi:hypothetical protein